MSSVLPHLRDVLAPSPQRRWFAVLLAGAGAVAAWKVAALVLLHRAAEAAPGSLPVKTLLALVGIAFPICGLLVLWRRPGRASLVFAAFSICAGLHWGGPLELPRGELRAALIFFYLLVSSFLSETLLLHLAMLFPRRLALSRRRWPIRLLYAPTWVAALLAVIYLLAPAGGEHRAAAEGSFFLAHLVVSNLFPLLALGIFVSHLLRPGFGGTEKRYIGLMVAGMLIAWLPYLIASAFGAETDPWNLTVVALPLGFAVGILGITGVRQRTA